MDKKAGLLVSMLIGIIMFWITGVESVSFYSQGKIVLSLLAAGIEVTALASVFQCGMKMMAALRTVKN